MRNIRAKGSPSGLNQTSAIFSPLYFKAAHCFEGGCSEKFTTHLLPLRINPYGHCIASNHVAMSHWLLIVTSTPEGEQTGGVGFCRQRSGATFPLKPAFASRGKPRERMRDLDDLETDHQVSQQ